MSVEPLNKDDITTVREAAELLRDNYSPDSDIVRRLDDLARRMQASYERAVRQIVERL